VTVLPAITDPAASATSIRIGNRNAYRVMVPPYGRWHFCDSLIQGETPLFAVILQAGLE
jgi:hypothetical protein